MIYLILIGFGVLAVILIVMRVRSARRDRADRSAAVSQYAHLIKTPIIVNENNSIDETGALYVFATISALEIYLEPWYVDESHFIFDSAGMQLEITARDERVHLAPKEPRTIDREIARTYFAQFLKAVARAKGWSHVGMTEKQAEMATLRELAGACEKFADR